MRESFNLKSPILTFSPLQTRDHPLIVTFRERLRYLQVTSRLYLREKLPIGLKAGKNTF